MKRDNTTLRFCTRAIHVGNEADPATGAVVPPIHVASTFVQPGAGQWGEFDYSRSGNPTRSALQRTLADLEGGCGALAFSTGMAATHCVTQLLSSGDEIVAGSDLYGGSYRLLHKICNRSGIKVKLVDLTQPDQLQAALTDRTKLVWFEPIGNPLMTVPDAQQIVRIGHEVGALVAVDNTFATPVLFRPLEMGADIVMHSATKYLGGHSDCLGGTLAVRDPQLYEQLYFIQNATGAVLDPFSCFLISRGIKTLQLRVMAQSETALRIARWLQASPQVVRVLYPGLESHPAHTRSRELFGDSFGGMLSFQLDADLQATKSFVESTKLFRLAVSLGAVESLIEQPALMSHASYDPQDRQRFGIEDGLVRLSVGLEAFEDLRHDLAAALHRIGVVIDPRD